MLRLMPGLMICILSCRSPVSPAADRSSYRSRFLLAIDRTFSNFRTKVYPTYKFRKPFGEKNLSIDINVKRMTLSDFEIEMAGRLTLFREALKIKQKEVAEGSESSQSHISAMEKGKRQIQR